MPEAVATREIAFTFGRFNPPTVGHEKLIKKVASASSAFKIFLSRSEDKKKNPLSPRTKLCFLSIVETLKSVTQI